MLDFIILFGSLIMIATVTGLYFYLQDKKIAKKT